MKPALISFILILLIKTVSAQTLNLQHIADSIETEGKMLFKSEWASWYGEDAFNARCPEKRPLLGGYLSYDTGKGLVNVLLGKGDDPAVLGTISFGYDYDPLKYQLDTLPRKFNKTEAELFKIRLAALKKMQTDTIFKTYKNASLNPIPMIINGEKRVYVLTGPSVSGVVLFGNDYLMRLNKKDEVTSLEKIHKGLIAIGTKSENGNVSVGSVHSHLPQYSPFITATDICTLMLYEKRTTWNQHIVISKDYVSLWLCKLDKLTIITEEAWHKMNPVKDGAEAGKN